MGRAEQLYTASENARRQEIIDRVEPIRLHLINVSVPALQRVADEFARKIERANSIPAPDAVDKSRDLVGWSVGGNWIYLFSNGQFASKTGRGATTSYHLNPFKHYEVAIAGDGTIQVYTQEHIDAFVGYVQRVRDLMGQIK